LRVPESTTGTLLSTPVQPLENGGRRWLVAENDTVDWVSNARASRWAILSWGKTPELVELVEVGPHQTAPVVRDFAQRMRGHRSVTATDPDLPSETFEEDPSAHPVFEIISGRRTYRGGR
jgi:hypothetical protein